MYTHTHSQKMAKKNNRKRPHQVSATVLCNSILLFFSIWERKEENTVGDLALDTHTHKETRKCLEKITNLNTQVKIS